MSNSPDIEIRDRYRFAYDPARFRDHEPLAPWLREAGLNPRLVEGIVREDGLSLVGLLDALQKHAQEEEAWPKWRYKDDKPDDVRALTPRFLAPPDTEAGSSRTRIHLMFPNQRAHYSVAIVEKIDEPHGDEQVFRGQEIVWSEGQTIGPGMHIRKATDQRVEPLPPSLDDPNVSYRHNGIKAIVAAAVEFLPEIPRL